VHWQPVHEPHTHTHTHPCLVCVCVFQCAHVMLHDLQRASTIDEYTSAGVTVRVWCNQTGGGGDLPCVAPWGLISLYRAATCGQGAAVSASGCASCCSMLLCSMLFSVGRLCCSWSSLPLQAGRAGTRLAVVASVATFFVLDRSSNLPDWFIAPCA
jgi:hypothetical protein